MVFFYFFYIYEVDSVWIEIFIWSIVIVWIVLINFCIWKNLLFFLFSVLIDNNDKIIL